MKRIVLMTICAAVAAYSGLAGTMAELKNGQDFAFDDLPEEMSVQLKRGGSVRFLMEENGTTGYLWEAVYSTNECTVVIEHRGAPEPKEGEPMLCGAPGKAAVKIVKNAAVQSPSLVEFHYRRNWEKGVKPIKTVRVVLYTIPGEDIGTPKCLKLEQ